MTDGTDDPLAPYAGHGGSVGRIFATSEPWWPERRRPRAGAPNIVVVMCDDIGYSDVGCYGSEIPTPNIDRLAEEGLRYRDYHATPMCSPTRASLLTGLEPHRAGVGHVAHSDPGFPGYAMELTPLAPTLPALLRDAGYQTLMVGKWHLTKDSQVNDAGDRSSWPLQQGFDRYYGFLDAFTNFHQPHRLIEDNHAVQVDRYPEDYFVTDDLTDHAISMVRESVASDPSKPFFLYLAQAAVHAPLQARAVDIARHAEVYHEGWDEFRRRRYERQVELGVIPPDAELAPRNHEPGDEVAAWDDLDDDRRRLFARYMAVYAGLIDNLDQNLGRLRSALEELGVWDDTLFIFTSDNGGSREGEEDGTSAYFRTLHHGRTGAAQPFEEDLARLEDLGGPRTLPHYPRGWAMVSNTPFRLYKINAHRGGHSVPFVVTWPNGGLGEGGAVREQFIHVSDLMPTFLELAGVERPDTWLGRPVLPLYGESVAATLRDPDAPGRTADLVVENEGHRGFRRGRWEAVTRHVPRTAFSEEHWELYDAVADPTQLHDLAEQQPQLLGELVAAWEEAAWSNQIFPMDEGTGYRYLLRPSWTEVFDRPVVLRAGTPTLDRWRSQRLILWRDVDVEAHVHLREGDAGVLVAHGDQGGGYSLYVDRTGELVAAHNGYGLERSVRGPVVEPGERRLALHIRCPGQDRWNLSLSIDGVVVAAEEDFRLLMAMAPFEGIDVGLDRRSPVCWEVYERHGPFPFTGTIESVAYSPGSPAPDSPVDLIEFLRDWGRRFE
ncbi:MAG: arylsulfatase [Acidobacteria bacterium]|nr:arylsulfatase [Acidobacteriota bacterium]